MARTLLIAISASCLCGVLLGLGTTAAFLSVNRWQPEYETTSYEILTQTVQARANPNARAHIEETTHYFGVMDAKIEGYHEFYITNTGTADLILAVDRISCSCLGIDITPARVPPGRTATCHLRYTAEQAVTGKFAQGGIVTTNDPENSEIYLSVEGVFTNPVVVLPAVLNFSRVPAGISRTMTLRFYGFENEPLQLTAPTWADREHFDFHWETAEFNEADEESGYLSLAKSVVEGTLTLKPGLPAGSFQEWFQVRTNYPNHANVHFGASGQIISSNVAVSGHGYNSNRSTGIAQWGHIIEGRSISREFSIQFSGPAAQSASVRVGAVEPDWIQARLSPPTDAGARRIFSLTVVIPENAPTGNFRFGSDGPQAYVTLETNDETTPIVRIPLEFVIGR